MEKPIITAWLKTSCGWSNGVRAVLKKYDLPYEEKDIIKNPAFALGVGFVAGGVVGGGFGFHAGVFFIHEKNS